MIPELDDYAITEAMLAFGGSFVVALAEAFRKGDPINQAKLKAAYSELWATYAEMVRLRGARAGQP